MTSREAGEIARLLSYVALLAGAAALFVSAGDIPASRFEALGAAAFPRFVFAAIGLVAIIAIVDALRKIPISAWARFGADTVSWARRRSLVFICLAAFALYIGLLPVLGFTLSSFGFVFGLQVLLMPRKPATLVIALAAALIFSFGINWLFAEVFTVFLPRGLL